MGELWAISSVGYDSDDSRERAMLGAPSVIFSALFAVGSQLVSTIGQVWWERWPASSGPVALNLYKCTLGSMLFVAVCTVAAVASGGKLPTVSADAAQMLVLSSFIGIVVGDVLWLQALKMLGAELVILLNAFNPSMGAVVGIVFLGQRMTAQLWLGVILTSIGVTASQLFKPRPAKTIADSSSSSSSGAASSSTTIASAAAEPTEMASSAISVSVAGDAADDTVKLNPSGSSAAVLGASPLTSERQRLRTTTLIGCCLQLLNMALDVAGAAITRAHGEGLMPIQINLIRFGAAAAMTAVVAACARLYACSARGCGVSRTRPPPSKRAEELAAFFAARMPSAQRGRRFWATMSVGVVFVTFLCPTMSNAALFGLPFGAYCTLTSVGPMWSVLVLFVMKGQRPTGLGCAGAALAAVGAALVSTAAPGAASDHHA